MPYYGYVGPTLKTVFDNFKPIETLRIQHPYSSYKRFKHEGAAWDWVGKQSTRKIPKSITRYGDVFDDHFVTVDYIITEDCIYYNVKTKRLGFVKLSSMDPEVSIENRAEIIKIKLRGLNLNPDLIISHLIAIYHIFRLLGTFVDVELCVPDHSIFFTLTRYTGNNRRINKVLDFLKNRKGNHAITLKNYTQGKNE